MGDPTEEKKPLTVAQARTVLMDLAQTDMADGLPGQAATLYEIAEMLSVQARETTYWKYAASYLADCHAATAYGVCSRKSGSKSEKRRLLSICGTAADLLKEVPTDKPSRMQRSSEDVAKRCRDAVVEFEGLQ